FVDYKKATNHSAKNWFEDESTLKLPVDNRPLRDTAAPSSSNVIAYERRPNSTVDLAKGKAESDVFFIGEDTPLPESHREQIARTDDDDILYIG
ncbi:MAG: hypothetical protein QF886_27250, partial [Planctomycetota bacterium]|nr:hypothetical protein [Planctomycetota bacterium]